MSYTEYNDLYKKAQISGNYKMFLLDIKNSKQMESNIRRNANILSLKLLKNIYIKLNSLEKDLAINILHRNPIFNNKNNHRLDLNEPFQIAGDSFGFTILRNTLADELVYTIITNEKQKLGIEFDYHISTAYYETDNYVEGGIKYFRGYCMSYLVNEKEQRVKKL